VSVPCRGDRFLEAVPGTAARRGGLVHNAYPGLVAPGHDRPRALTAASIARPLIGTESDELHHLRLYLTPAEREITVSSIDHPSGTTIHPGNGCGGLFRPPPSDGRERDTPRSLPLWPIADTRTHQQAQVLPEQPLQPPIAPSVGSCRFAPVVFLFSPLLHGRPLPPNLPGWQKELSHTLPGESDSSRRQTAQQKVPREEQTVPSDAGSRPRLSHHNPGKRR